MFKRFAISCKVIPRDRMRVMRCRSLGSSATPRRLIALPLARAMARPSRVRAPMTSRSHAATAVIRFATSRPLGVEVPEVEIESDQGRLDIGEPFDQRAEVGYSTAQAIQLRDYEP